MSAGSRASEALRESCTSQRRHSLFTRQRLPKKFSLDMWCTAIPRAVHRFSTLGGSAMLIGVSVLLLVLATDLRAQSQADVDASTFRVFLRDGRGLPAYGEAAVVGDRVVFSLIVGGGAVPVAFQLMSLPASSVDVDRTARYAKAVRAAYFASASGEAEYQAITSDVAATLDSLPAVSDPAARLQMAEGARQRLQRWSTDHYDYHGDDIRRFMGEFDVVIAQLRAGTSDSVTLDLVAGAGEPRPERVQPPMTLRESIAAALFAAKAADDGPTREAVLRTVAGSLAASDAEPDLRALAENQLADEINADRVYAALSADLLAKADAARLRADVARAEALPAELTRRDADLGHRRPEIVQGLADAISVRLAATRAYRAALDHYALEKPQLLAYARRISPVVAGLGALTPTFERIRDGRRVGYDTTAWILNRLAALQTSLARTEPPADLGAVQAALTSVIELERQACLRHKQALVTPESDDAAEASAAAAGAVLLLKQARQDLAAATAPPTAS